MSLFQRAWAGLNLSPAERAWLKLIEGFILAGIVAALPAVAELLSAGTVDWATVGRTALGTFAVAVLMAAVKYCKAHGDSPLAEPLGQVLTGVATQIGNATGLNEPKQGVVLPPAEPVVITPPAVPTKDVAPAS